MAVSKVKKSGKLEKPGKSLLEQKLEAQRKIMKSMSKDGDGGRIPGDTPETVDFRTTGLPVFDETVLGIGGVPKGKFIEVYGKESSGKTALSLYVAGRVQSEDPLAIVKVYDAERAWTDDWGQSMGLDLKRVVLPDFRGADAMAEQIQADLASKFPPDIIIIDSLAVVQPSQVLMKTVEDFNMNDNMARATFYKEFLNKIVDGYYWPPTKKSDKNKPKSGQQFCDLKKSGTTIIGVNHAKPITKSVGGRSYIDWETPCGKSPRFHAAIRMMITRGYIKDVGDRLQYQIVHVKADKNKLAPPLRECDIKLSYKGGMEQIGTVDYLEIAESTGLATVSGGWISADFLPNGKIQGRTNFNNLVETNPKFKSLFAQK